MFNFGTCHDRTYKRPGVKAPEAREEDIAESLGLHVDNELDLGDEIFKEMCGAFVTLHIKGRLRAA